MTRSVFILAFILAAKISLAQPTLQDLINFENRIVEKFDNPNFTDSTKKIIVFTIYHWLYKNDSVIKNMNLRGQERIEFTNKKKNEFIAEIKNKFGEKAFKMIKPIFFPPPYVPLQFSTRRKLDARESRRIRTAISE